jgi:hypothetical protein
MKKAVLPMIMVLAVIVGLAAVAVFPHYFSEWSSRRKHAHLIEQAFNQRLLPASAFVREFVERKHRLPDDLEMERYNRGKSGWDVVRLCRDRPPWLDRWGVGGRDFFVTTSVPEWNLYYCSWDNKRFEAWTD